MAYVEVWKSGKLLVRRGADEERARRGCRIRLGSVGEVRIAIGQTETLGEFKVCMFAGEPPIEKEAVEETATLSPEEVRSTSPGAPGEGKLSNKTTNIPNIKGYKIIEPLGQGGMGIVWRAEQFGTRREVALKLLVSHRIASPKAQARFQREVELTARLDHPSIARIYDSGLHMGKYYYVMELVDGVPLDEFVKSKSLSRTQILALMHKVCLAVFYAHLRAVIHRDLKPSNIIITEDGQPHVLDFGLAKALLDEDETLMISIEGQIAGTPAYMSPEQAAGHHSRTDTRTDVFSLGVILYELLTGQSPHDLSGRMFDLLREVIDGRVRKPREVDKSIDLELEALLLKALALKPEDRYDSAGALANDIHNYLDEEPLDARIPTTLYFLRKKALKYRKQVGIAAAVLIIIFVTVLSAYTKVVGDRAVLRMAQERNILLETELENLRAKLRSGNPEEVQAALATLEQKYRASQARVEELRGILDGAVVPKGPAPVNTPNPVFYFGEPANLGEPINTPELDGSATISRDGLEMYFCSRRVGGLSDGKEDIWVVTRAKRQDPWGYPVNLGLRINSPSADRMSRLSHDGLSLYFASNRPGGYGDFDLYVIERSTTDAPWSEPKNLGSVVNGTGTESDSSVSADNLVLYFSSTREGSDGDSDIWIATRETTQDPWGQPIKLGSNINGPSYDAMPYISSDGLILLFSSGRTGGYGGGDIYISRRTTTDQSWSEPVNLGPIVNSPKEDHLPVISPSDSAILVNSGRAGGYGNFDIWLVPTLSVSDFNFGEAVNLGSMVNSSNNDRSPSISADGLSLYFDSRRSGGIGSLDIWVAKRATISAPWGKSENLGSIINTSALDGQPCISADSLTLYFSSDRPGGSGHGDIWLSTRPTKNDEWGPPANIGPVVNTSSHDGGPSISADGLSLYFESGQHGSNPDIWVTKRPTLLDTWGEPVNLGSTVNSAFGDGQPCISADGLLLFFHSKRSGDSRIWVTTRSSVSEPWNRPVNLGSMLNSSRGEMVPCISADGSTLYFSSQLRGSHDGDDIWQMRVYSPD